MSKDLKEKSKKKIKVSRKKILAVLVVVGAMIAALLVGVLARWIQVQVENSSSGDANVTIQGLPSNPPPSELNKAQEEADQGNYETSNESITEELEKSNDGSVKYELYLQQGINYENQEKYDEAVQSYTEAEKISQTSAVYEALGRVYELKGDNQAAINVYKKAIEYKDPESPLADMEIDYYKERIEALGGSL